MKVNWKGLMLALLQVAIVASLGGKLLYDRATRPRIWVRAAPVDPDLPVRGRYVQLRLEVRTNVVFSPHGGTAYDQPVQLKVDSGQLFAEKSDKQTGINVDPLNRFRQRRTEAATGPASPGMAVLSEPVAFFIPEHVPDPSLRRANEELWVEVTVPKKGPPRPIRLGVKTGEEIKPLQIP
jgi:uncharacterized membrane-anchored protein